MGGSAPSNPRPEGIRVPALVAGKSQKINIRSRNGYELGAGFFVELLHVIVQPFQAKVSLVNT